MNSTESPFEFRALEVTLEAICSFLDARTTELETDAYPALDELTSKVSGYARILCSISMHLIWTSYCVLIKFEHPRNMIWVILNNIQKMC
jgi:hypothetical protein